MAGKPRLILHIGTHKTATSTLQTLMASQKDMLREQGFLYPRTDRQPHPTKVKHGFFGRTMVQNRVRFQGLHQQMLKEFRDSGCHTMVLSEEGLATPRMTKFSGALGIFARDFDIEVICYLRRQDYFAESFWNFLCKIGKETGPISGMIRRRPIIKYMTYLTMLDKWSGVAKVKAIGFEAARDQGIVESFSQVTGMDLPQPRQSRNISPSMSLAAALSVLNKEFKDIPWDRIEPYLGADTRRTALGSKLRRDLLDRFADHNAELAKRYGVHFPETMPDEEEEPVAPPGPEALALLRAALRHGQKRADQA